eukprot:1477894-Rhodomonas_salina.2
MWYLVHSGSSIRSVSTGLRLVSRVASVLRFGQRLRSLIAEHLRREAAHSPNSDVWPRTVHHSPGTGSTIRAVSTGLSAPDA